MGSWFRHFLKMFVLNRRHKDFVGPGLVTILCGFRIFLKNFVLSNAHSEGSLRVPSLLNDIIPKWNAVWERPVTLLTDDLTKLRGSKFKSS